MLSEDFHLLNLSQIKQLSNWCKENGENQVKPESRIFTMKRAKYFRKIKLVWVEQQKIATISFASFKSLITWKKVYILLFF